MSAVAEKRKPLSRREVIQLMLDQNGRCGCGCGVKLDPMKEGVIDEHVTALELTGTNDLANRSLWRKPCSAAKTKLDQGVIAKAKRRAAESCQWARRQKMGGGSIPARENPWPQEGRAFPTSRVFSRSLKKKLNGAVVRREKPA